jgi:DNA-binding CsgD family transcriptional regulator
MEIIQDHTARPVAARRCNSCAQLMNRADSFYDHRAQADLIGTLIADAGFGVILTTPTGQIIYANNVASNLIRLRRGLCSQQGRLKTTDVSNQKLQSLISAASLPASETLSEGSMILSQQDSDEILAVHVVPISEKSSGRFVPQGRPIAGPFVAGLIIVDRTQGASERATIFASLFGLTPSETRLLAALTSEKSLTFAARRLKITESTARTHLKHIMGKTSTHRQAELMGLFIEMTTPYGGRKNCHPLHTESQVLPNAA